MSTTFSRLDGINVIDPRQLSRAQRLERWALALDKLGDARLKTLKETEHQHYYERMLMREDNSPLTVAFDDPVLRTAGLKDDTFGEAARFFDLSDWDLHGVLCYCHSGSDVGASEVASRVRSVQAQAGSRTTTAWTYGIVVGALTAGMGLLVMTAL